MYYQFKNYRIHSTFILLLCLASCKSPEKDNLIQDSSFLGKITSYFEKEVEGSHLKEIGGLAYNEGETKPYTGRVVYLSNREGSEGKITKTGHYKKGLKNGEWISISMFYKKKTKEIYFNGKLLENYVSTLDGDLIFTQKRDNTGNNEEIFYSSNGKVRHFKKINNEGDGEEIFYYPSGKILAKASLSNGIFKSPFEDSKVYWENGRVLRGIILGRVKQAAGESIKIQDSNGNFSNSTSEVVEAIFVIDVLFNKDGHFEKFKLSQPYRYENSIALEMKFAESNIDFDDFNSDIFEYTMHNRTLSALSGSDMYGGYIIDLEILPNNYGITTSNLMDAEHPGYNYDKIVTRINNN
jgi:antitoxin component YwqK of YwqJK toxin-antitoxin module